MVLGNLIELIALQSIVKKCSDDIGFRIIIQVLNGEEPEQKVDLYTLDPPLLSSKLINDKSILLSWEPVNDAVEYQIFEYSKYKTF